MLHCDPLFRSLRTWSHRPKRMMDRCAPRHPPARRFWIALLAIGLQPLAAVAGPLPTPPSWQQEYWAGFDRGDWEAAIASAEQLVAAARPASPETAVRLAEALSLLGNAQLGKGNFVAAEAAYTEAVTLTEKYVSDRSSARLVDPLRGLGYTLAAQGKHDKAVPYMDRALLISRRTAGLFDTSQQGLLRQLATSLSALGTPADAEKHMMYLLRVGEHAYGDEDPRMIPLHVVVGKWYEDVAQIYQARQSYRTAIGIAERKLGRNDLGVVAPLRGLAGSYVQEMALTNAGIAIREERLSDPADDDINEIVQPMNPRYLSSEGERALLRSLKILEAHPERSTQTFVETLVQAGDWFLTKMQQPTKAMSYYARAAAIIDETQDRATLGSAATLLSFPVQVYYVAPDLATRLLTLPRNQIVERFVQVEFTVTADGTVKDQRAVDQDAGTRQQSQTLDAIRDSRYRPRFVDGKPVETTAVGYRQIFRQRRDSE